MDEKNSKKKQLESRLTFGQFLAQCRIQKKLTQKQLAELLFVEASTISKWEMDKRRPDIEFISKLSEMFGITESELIRASIDNSRNTEKKQAKRYRIIKVTYNLIHLIVFAIAILTCFIVNLATSKTLNWFFIVLSAIICYASHMILPQHIKKYKLVFIPLSSLLSIYLLLFVCSIYTSSRWFVIPFIAMLFSYSIIFIPLIIKKYNFPILIKRHNALFSITIDSILLFILLIVINIYTAVAGSNAFGWCFSIGIPVALFWLIPIYLTIVINKYIKINGFFKTSILLFIWLAMLNIFYFFLDLLEIGNDGQGMFWEANFFEWTINEIISANIMCIIHVIVLIIFIVFIILGFVSGKKKRKTFNG